MQLGDQLSVRCERYLQLGFIPMDEMAAFQGMFDT